ncbi:hypothetical protein BHE74_00003049 [Ensete ventricosum]|nr:hypothetical protein GW17_00008383 [Ensete ventricosum]RWW88096.1 hypothetical protein BHE74_00003049 [Ensete ventricosum]
MMALREILTHHGSCAGVYFPDLSLEDSFVVASDEKIPIDSTKRVRDIDLNMQYSLSESEPELKIPKVENELCHSHVGIGCSDKKMEDGTYTSMDGCPWETTSTVLNNKVDTGHVKVKLDPCTDGFSSELKREDDAPPKFVFENCNSVSKMGFPANLPESSKVMKLIKLARHSWTKNWELLQDYAIRFLCVLSLDRQEWEVRHGSLLGIKYLEMIVDLLDYVLPACKAGLEDPDDDVRAVAAEALIPTAAAITSLDDQMLHSIVMLLWDILLDLDDLSPSTSRRNTTEGVFVGLLDNVKQWLLDLLSCSDPSFPTKGSREPYTELSRTYAKMRNEASHLFHLAESIGIFKDYISSIKFNQKSLTVDEAINFASNLSLPLESTVENLEKHLVDDIESSKQQLLSTSAYLKCVQLIRSIAPVLNDLLRPQLLTLLPSILWCVCHHHVAVRLAASRCITSMAKSMESSVMGAVIENVIPILSDSTSVHARQGAGMLVHLLVQGLGVELVPYAPLLVVPLLRCMGDCDHAVRQTVTHSFAALVPLLPLARGLPSPVGLSESLSRNAEDAQFLEQLLDNSHIDDYKLPIDLSVSLRRSVSLLLFVLYRVLYMLLVKN